MTTQVLLKLSLSAIHWICLFNIKVLYLQSVNHEVMHLINDSIQKLFDLCQRYKVSRLYVFGSIVFGSNMSGYHVGCAAKYAAQHFGAVYGWGEGLQGKSYAIPTMQPTVDMVRPNVERFIKFARKNTGLPGIS